MANNLGWPKVAYEQRLRKWRKRWVLYWGRYKVC
jgi:hypothetical protein